MEKINDPGFGEMFFKFGWKKKECIEFWKKEVMVDIIAAAYTGERIDKVQQNNYLHFKKNILELSNKSFDSLRDYILKNIKDIQFRLGDKVDFENLINYVEIESIIFNKDGTYGLLCDCAWDRENGIGIELSQMKVDSQDILL